VAAGSGPRRSGCWSSTCSPLANRLQAITDVENLAEQRVLERIGFHREGVMRGLAFIGGRWRDGVPDRRENAGARFDKGRLVERGAEPDQEVAA
jgi:hypothetical protein